MTRFGILISGRGSNMEALARAAQGLERASVAVVCSNKPSAPGLDIATSMGLPTAVLSHKGYPKRRDYNRALATTLRAYEVDWVLLAGFMRILGGGFLDSFGGRVMNIHPSLLPAFPGLNPQRQALEAGVSESGCTVHLVDRGTDTGPIVAQAAVPVHPGDDEQALSARILEAEHRLYPAVMQWIAAGQLHVDGGTVSHDIPREAFERIGAIPPRMGPTG